ncbi:MAG: NUDIX hydrolase [Desulfobacterales bacterium]|nr:NUDIX hydrolase [Desulfobacterales bacterium]
MSAKINHVSTVYQGRVFTLDKENVTLGNGVTTDLDVIHHPGAAAMVPLTDDGQVVMLRQYRHAIRQNIWEIPAGTLEPDEDSETCARREVEEETGYAASTFVRLGTIIPVPGYSDETITLFLCTGLILKQQTLDADEQIMVSPVPFDETITMIHDGHIQDAKSIAGLFMARQHLESQKGC